MLRLFVERVFHGGATTLGVFALAQGEGEATGEPRQGIASRYPGDLSIGDDPRVVFADGFESDRWPAGWTHMGKDGRVDVVEEDAARRFEPLRGKALRAQIAEGEHLALDARYKFSDETGEEPEEVFFRYYLRLGDAWAQTVAGGKMPGISGTYGVAGWGGRPDGRRRHPRMADADTHRSAPLIVDDLLSLGGCLRFASRSLGWGLPQAATRCSLRSASGDPAAATPSVP